MIYGIYTLNGKQHPGFYTPGEWITAISSHGTKVNLIIDFKTHGKTYRERKKSIIEKAHDFEALFSDYGVPISYGELSIFQDYFETQGKKYGLLTEFKENGII